MLLTLVIFLSTFFSIYHLISSSKFRLIQLRHVPEERGISILIPCYNEAKILINTIQGITRLKYSNLQVIFINDGSNDATFNVLYKDLKLSVCSMSKYEELATEESIYGLYQSEIYPYIYVIDKENSGKANSLNCGVSFAEKEYILTLDADCILEEDALIYMNKTFEDKKIIASGGTVHAMQLFKLTTRPKLIILLQALDLIKGFYIYKSSLAYNNALAIISGAFGMFNKAILVELGGFYQGLGEDIDITLRFQEYALTHDKKVTYTLDALCFTECPEKWRDLIKQRVRWQKAFIDSCLKNSKFLFKYMFTYNLCFFLIIDALIISSCSISILLVNMILILSPNLYSVIGYLIFCYLLPALFNTLYCYIAINRAKKQISEINKPLLYMTTVFDFFVFRPLCIFFFLFGTLTYPFSHKKWNKVERTSHSYKI